MGGGKSNAHATEIRAVTYVPPALADTFSTLD
jgi:hypothetical protein